MLQAKEKVIAFSLGMIAFLFLLFIIFGTFARGEVVQENAAHFVVNLSAGKNNVSFDRVTFARDVVVRNPFIQTISYLDEHSGESIGYVNAFGGLGKNFLIIPGTEYEVTVQNESTLRL